MVFKTCWYFSVFVAEVTTLLIILDLTAVVLKVYTLSSTVCKAFNSTCFSFVIHLDKK